MSLAAFRPFYSSPLRSLLLASACIIFISQADATELPSGGSFAAGTGSISVDANAMLVQQSTAAGIINWDSFSIGQSGSVHFDNANGATLNRVLGGDASRLDGRLSATGSLYLLNPQGVLIGAEGRVHTGGDFIASTKNITDTDFLNGGAIQLSGNSAASVRNSGTIEAAHGSIYLLAREVENTGRISAPKGDATLAAGNGFTLQDTQVGGLKVEPRADGRVSNSGSIEAVRAELNAAGGNVFALGNNQQGVVRATGVEQRQGEVWLTGRNIQNSGTIAANNANGSGGTVTLQAEGRIDHTGKIAVSGANNKGGEARLLGEQIAIYNGGAVDASGATGGGDIFVGGDRMGGRAPAQRLRQQENIPNAKAVFVGSTASLRSDATNNGNGGHVIIWSDDATRFYGSASAQGGAQGGNGGFIETSGGWIDINPASISTAAPLGRVGEWLLDPTNIEITAATDSYTPSPDFPDLIPTSAGTAQVSVGTIRAALITSDVSISTAAAGAGAGNITWLAGANLDIDTLSSRTLQLRAHNNITIDGAIIDSDTGTGDGLNIILDADSDSSGGGQSNIRTTFNTFGGSFESIGDITLEADINTTRTGTSGSIFFSNDVLLRNIGGITLTSGASDITFGGLLNSADSSNISSLILDTTGTAFFGRSVGNTQILDSVDFGSASTISIDGEQFIVNNSLSFGNPVFLPASNDLSIQVRGANQELLFQGNITKRDGTAQTVSFEAAGYITITQGVTVSSLGGALNLNLRADRDGVGGGGVVIGGSVTPTTIDTSTGTFVVGGGTGSLFSAGWAEGDASNAGIYMRNTTVITDTGAISLRGRGAQSGAFALSGIYLQDSSFSTNSNIFMTGVGGTGTTSAAEATGIWLSGTSLTTTTGTIALEGTGGINGNGNNNNTDLQAGVRLQNNALIEATGNGTININGIAGSGGVTGTVELPGGTGNVGFLCYTTNCGTVRTPSGGGSARINADSMALNDGSYRSAVFTLAPITTENTHTIRIGSAADTTANSLEISAAELAGFTTTGTLRIGSISYSNPIQFSGTLAPTGIATLSVFTGTDTGADITSVASSSLSGITNFAVRGRSIDLSNLSISTTNLAASSTGTVRLNGVFDINTVDGTNGITASLLRIDTTGTITQSARVIAPSLVLSGVGGVFDLNTQNNVITTLAADTGIVRFRDDGGYTIGALDGVVGITTTGATRLVSTGTVSQNRVITAPELALLGVGGIFNLNSNNNAIDLLAASAGTVRFRDDNGYQINSADGLNDIDVSQLLRLQSDGAVTTGVGFGILAPELLLTGTDGDFILSAAFVTLAANARTVDIANPIAIPAAIGTVDGVDGVTATGNVALFTSGTISQSQPIIAQGLELGGMGTFANDGTFNLNTQNNDINSLAATVETLQFRDDNGFDVGTVGSTDGIITTALTHLVSSGIVTNNFGITAPGLLLTGANGVFILTYSNNSVGTVAANTGTLYFRANDGFDVGSVSGTNGITASTALGLVSIGTVTQTQIVSAPELALVGVGGVFNLNSSNNAISTLAADAGTVRFRDDSGFAIGSVDGVDGIKVTGVARLVSAGTVTQSRIITAPELALLGTDGIFSLNSQNNDVAVLAADTATVRFRNDDNYSLGTADGVVGMTTTSLLRLHSTAIVTQVDDITTNGLLLTGAGGTFNLNVANVDVATLAADTDIIRIRKTAASVLDIGTVDGVSGITTVSRTNLISSDTVTQSQAIISSRLLLAGLATGEGTFNLHTQNNDVNQFATDVATVRFRDDNGFALDDLGAAEGIDAAVLAHLITSGTVTRTFGAVNTPSLVLAGVDGIYNFADSSVTITNLAANTGTVRLRDDDGFMVTTVDGVEGVTASSVAAFDTTSLVMQDAAINAGNLLLTGATGIYNLNTSDNNVGTLAASADYLRFRDDTGFDIGTVDTVNGITATTVVRLLSSGTVTQTQSIITPELAMLGTDGVFSLNSVSNSVDFIAASTGTVRFRRDNNYEVSTADGFAGITTSGITRLETAGTVTQTQPLTTDGLVLGGAGGAFNLTNLEFNTLAADTAAFTIENLNLGATEIGTVDGVSGVTVTGAIAFGASGTVTQSQAVVANSLALYALGGAGTFSLHTQNNNTNTLAANVVTLRFRDDDGFTIDDIGPYDMDATTLIHFITSGTVTQAAGAPITTLGLALSGTGGIFALDSISNSITDLAANTGEVFFRDDNGYDIDTVDDVVGATTLGELLLRTAGNVTQTQQVDTDLLTLLGDGGSGNYIIDHAGNLINNVRGKASNIHVNTSSFMQLRALPTPDDDYSFDVTGRLILSTTASNVSVVDNTGAVRAPEALFLTGSFSMPANGFNNFGTVAANAAFLFLHEDTTYDIGVVEGVAGITTTDRLWLSGNANVTQTEAINTADLTLTGASGTFNFAGINNNAVRVQGNTANIYLRDDDGFTITQSQSGAAVEQLHVSGILALTTSGTIDQSSTDNLGELVVNNLVLRGAGSTYNLHRLGNYLTTVAAEGAFVRLRDVDGFAIGTVDSVSGITATTLARLQTDGTVTQSQVITTPSLVLMGLPGTFDLNTQNNVINTLASNTGIVRFRDDDGFAIGTVDSVNGLTAGTARLQTTGTVTQSQSISVSGLLLTGAGGTFTFNTQNNSVNQLAADTATVRFRDDGGFAIAAVDSVNGLTASTLARLESTGTVIQTHVITTPSLLLSGVAGIFTLNTQNNAITTLASNTETVRFREDGDYVIGTVDSVSGLTVTGLARLESTGTVTQSQIITAPGLALMGAAGVFTLNTQNNSITTLAGNTDTVRLREDGDYAIGTVDSVTGLTVATLARLQSTGTVTQTEAIAAPSLLLSGTGGIFNLNSNNNTISTLAANTGTVRFREDGNYTIGSVDGTNGLVATSLVRLESTGTVTQGHTVFAPSLLLTGTGGSFTLNSLNNSISTLAADTNTVRFREDGGYAIGSVDGVNGATTTTLLRLETTSSVTQSQAINSTGLALSGSFGIFNLDTQSNTIGTLSANTTTVRFGEDGNYIIGSAGGISGLTATTVRLSSTGTVTQTHPIFATALALRGVGGIYNLNTTGNAIDNLAANTGTVRFREDGNYVISSVDSVNGLTVTDLARLQSTGTVTQSRVITAPSLLLTGGSAGTFTLNSQDNVITTLATNTGTVRFRDDTGYAIGTVDSVNGLTASTLARLQSAGTVTQTQAITAPSLLLSGTGGIFNLNSNNNTITTLAANSDTVLFREDGDYVIGTVDTVSGITATTLARLYSTGTVTQSQLITAPSLALTGVGGVFTLNTQNNSITTLASNTDTVRFREDGNYAIGSVDGVNGLGASTLVRLESTGTVTQIQPITTTGLLLTGVGGVFTLNTQSSNDIINLAANTGTVRYRDRDDYDIATVDGVSGLTTTTLARLETAGVPGFVTQSQAITTPGLVLEGTVGFFNLDTQNNSIDTLATSANTVRFREDGDYAIGTLDGVSGLSSASYIRLVSTGTVTQSNTIGTIILGLAGAGGVFNLSGLNNTISFFGADTGTLRLRDDNGFIITNTLDDANQGITVTDLLQLTNFGISAGSISQLKPIVASNLLLLGVGGVFDLNTQNNSITTLAADTEIVRFREDGDYEIGTVDESISGINANTLVRLQSTGTVTQSQIIATPGLVLTGAGGVFNLNTQNNNIDTLASDTGTVRFRNDSSFAIGTVDFVSGLTASTLARLQSTGTVTQSQIINTSGLLLTGTGGIFNFDTLDNVIGSLAANTDTVRFREDGDYGIGNIDSVVGITTATLTALSSNGTVLGFPPINSPGLVLRGTGTYILGDGNAITTLAGDTGAVVFADADGFTIGTVDGVAGLTADNYVYFITTSLVDQSAPLFAADVVLTGAGSDYRLNTEGNEFARLAGEAESIAIFANSSFEIAEVQGISGLFLTDFLNLESSGLVTQSQVIDVPSLVLSGLGSVFTLNTNNNSINTLAANAGTVRFRDDGGFDIGTVDGVNGLTVSAEARLTSTGTVTQSQIITAPGLALMGAAGVFNLNTHNNALDTLAGNTGTVRFRDDAGYAIGTADGVSGLTASTLARLQSDGTVTQSAAITAPSLLLTGAVGVFNLNSLSNAVDTIASDVATVRFRRDGSFSIATVDGISGLRGTTWVQLESTGTVSQTDTIFGGNLLLTGVGGVFDLHTQQNNTGRLAANTGTVRFQDTGNFEIGTVGITDGITVTGLLYLQTPGTVTQTQAITAPSLLLAGGSTGTFTLNTQNNAITTLAGNAGTVRFQDNTGFAIGTIDGVNGLSSTLIRLTSTGTVTQSQAINSPSLALTGVGGTFTLNTQNNAITLLAANTGTVRFRDDSTYSISTVDTVVGLTATVLASLQSAAAVQQSQAVTTPSLLLSGASALFSFQSNNNEVTTLAANTGSLRLRDDTGFDIGTVDSVNGVTASNFATLQSSGTVTQSQAINTSGLRLSGTSGIFDLNTQNNGITTLAANTGTVRFRDDGGFAIGTVDALNGVTLSNALHLTTGGTVTQSQGISSPRLVLTGVGGSYNLLAGVGYDNVVTTLAADTGSLRFYETVAGGYNIGSFDGVNGITATGDVYLAVAADLVSQTQPIVASGLRLGGITPRFELQNASNSFSRLAGVADRAQLRSTSAIEIGTVLGASGWAAAPNFSTNGYLDIQASGTSTQSQAITVGELVLRDTTATYNFNTHANAIDFIAADVATLRLRNDTNIAIGTVAGVAGITAQSLVRLQTNNASAFSQSQSITAPNLLLIGTGGVFDLNTQNNAITTLAANVDTLRLRDDTGFAIGTVDGINGVIAINLARFESTGTVTQSQAINTSALLLTGIDGVFNLNTQNNNIGTLAADTDTVRLRDDNGFAIGTVASTNGLIASTLVRLQSDGTVTQSQLINSPRLLLMGTDGIFDLNTQNNTISTIAANTSTLRFRDDNGFTIGTVDSADGLWATNLVHLVSSDLVTQNQTINTPGLVLTGVDGSFYLSNVNNDINTLAANTALIEVLDDNGFEIGTVDTVAGTTVAFSITLVGGNGASITQSQPIITPYGHFTSSGADFIFDHANNDIAELMVSLANNFTYNGSTNYVIDTNFGVGIQATGVVTLSTTAADVTVTSQANIVAPSLRLLTGIFDLDNTNNDVNSLAANAAALNFRDNDGFEVASISGTNGVTLSGDWLINSMATVSQSAPINVVGLQLTGAGGIFNLGSQNNNITTLAANTGTVRFRDDNGFAIGTVSGTNGLTVSTLARLQSNASITQSQAITAPSLLLTGVGGVFTLNTVNNSISTLSGTADQLSFRDDDGFNIGNVDGAVVTISGTMRLQSSGTVTQSQIIISPSLLLLGDNGIFNLNTRSNAVDTFAANTGTVRLRAGSGLDIGTVGGTSGLTVSTLALLENTGTVTQSQLISAPSLLLTGAGGIFNLNTQNNAISTFAADTGTVRLRDDTGFDINDVDGVSSTTLTTLAHFTSSGPVSLINVLFAPSLALSGTGGDFALLNIDIDNLATNTGTLGIYDSDGFVINTVDGISGVTVATIAGFGSDGTVTQNQAITADQLRLFGTGGVFNLNTHNNAVNALAASTNTVRFRDDTGFDIGSPASITGLTVSDLVLLQTAGTVTQTERISAPSLVLTGVGGIFNLHTQNNIITTLAADTGTVRFRDDDAFGYDIGTLDDVNGITASLLRLSSGGTVTQSHLIDVSDMLLTGAGATYNLNSISNLVDVFAADTGTVRLSFGSNMSLATVDGIAGATLTDLLRLNGTGAVTFSAPDHLRLITAPNLLLTGDGQTNYLLAGGIHDVDSLAVTANNFSFNDADGFVVDSVEGVDGISFVDDMLLSSQGVVTQNAGISGNRAFFNALNSGTVTFNLNTQLNDFNEIGFLVTTLRIADVDGFTIGLYNAAASDTLSISSDGTVNQTRAFSAPNLFLLGTGTIYNLNTRNNSIDTLAANTGTVRFREDGDYVIGSVEGFDGISAGLVRLNSTGTVTQTQAITADALAVTGAGGDFQIRTVSNPIGQLAADTAALAFRNDDSFVVGTVDGVVGITTTGDTLLETVNGAMTQTAPIVADGLVVYTALGSADFSTQNNNVNAIASNGSFLLRFRDDDGFNIDLISGLNGISGYDVLHLISNGVVSTVDPVGLQVRGLRLSGTGADYTLNVYNAGGYNTNIVADGIARAALSGLADVTIGTLDGVNGITVTDRLVLTGDATFAAAVNQTAAITAPELELHGNNIGVFTLNNSDNDIGNISGTGISALTLAHAGNITQSGALEVSMLSLGAAGSITLENANNLFDQLLVYSRGGALRLFDSAGGLLVQEVSSHASDVLLRTVGNLTLDTGASIGVSGAGNQAVLVTTGDFISDGIGVSALAGARYLVYQPDRAGEVRGAMTASGLYGRTYAANPPNSITPSNQSFFIYGHTPTVTVTANNDNRFYGAANPSFGFTLDGVLTGDSISGAPTLTSAANATSTVAGGPYAIVAGLGTLDTNIGYAYSFVNGLLTIDAALLQVTANDNNKIYGGIDPGFTYSVLGLQNGELASAVLSGALTRDNGENVGLYGITQGSLAANSNYVIDSFTGADFTIDRATLTLTADNQQRNVAQSNPPFTFSVTGLQFSDSLADLTPVVGSTDAIPQVSPAGSYTISLSGGLNNNYNTLYVPGTLTVVASLPPDNSTAAANFNNNLLSPNNLLVADGTSPQMVVLVATYGTGDRFTGFRPMLASRIKRITSPYDDLWVYSYIQEQP